MKNEISISLHKLRNEEVLSDQAHIFRSNKTNKKYQVAALNLPSKSA